MISSNNRTFFKVRLVVTAFILLALLLIVNFAIDLKPNSIIVNFASDNEEIITEIFYNNGQGFSEEPLASGEVSDVYAEDLKGLRIEIKRKPFLEKHNFMLQSFESNHTQLKSTWSALLPGFQPDIDQIYSLLLETERENANYQLYIGDQLLPLNSENGFLIAYLENALPSDVRNITIEETFTKENESEKYASTFDIRDLELGINAIYAINNGMSQIAIKSVQIAGYFSFLDYYMPLKIWEKDELVQDFALQSLSDDYLVEDKGIIFNLEKHKLTISHKGGFFSTYKAINSAVTRTSLLLNLFAIIISIILFYGLNLIIRLLNIEKSLFCSMNFFEENRNIIIANHEFKGVTSKGILAYLFILLLLVSFFSSQYFEGTNKLLIYILTILVGLVTSAKCKNPSLCQGEKLYHNYKKVSYIHNSNKRNLLVNKLKYWVKQEGWFYSIGLVILMTYGGILRLLHLGEATFYHDELFHYRALLGLLDHGNLAIYNPFTEELIRPYPRAALLTYFSYYLVELFGHNEFVIRLPVAIIGILLIPLFYFLAKPYLGKSMALIGAAFITINPYLIYLSRFFRDYSFLVFFYLLTFFLIFKLIEELIKKDISYISITKYSIFSLASILISFHFGMMQTFTLLPLLIYGLAVVLLLSKSQVKSFLIHKRKIIIAIVFLLFFVSLIEFILEYRIIGLQTIFQHIDVNLVSLISSPHSGIYINYLFPYNYSSFILVLITVVLIASIYSKHHFNVFVIGSCLLAYYMVAYLGDRYEDFRYISFLMPIAVLSVSISLKYIHNVLIITYNILLARCFILLVSLTMLTLWAPCDFGPNSQMSNHIAIGQPWWNENEGALLVHRRAVAPEYNEVFNYINKNYFDDDVFLFHNQSYVYLDKLPTQEVFLIGRDTKVVYPYFHADSETLNLLHSNNILFDDFLSIYEHRNIWFVGTYVHLMDDDIIDYMLNKSDFVNVGSIIGIKEFDYLDSWYIERETTWPTVLIRQSIEQ